MSEPFQETSAGAEPQRTTKYYGKFRGVVTNNIDPLGLMRIMVMVPDVPHDLDMWAVACVPYAGTAVGLHLIPPIGANVWVEFEGGNPSHPIWTGAYWEALEFVKPKTLNPIDTSMVKMLKTMFSTFVLDDTPGTGGMTLESTPASIPVPASFTFDMNGITLTCGPASIKMHPAQGITIAMGANSIKITPTEISMTAPTIKGTAAQKVAFTGTAGVDLTSAQAIKASAPQVNVEAATAANVKSGGACNVQGTALSLQGSGTAELKGGGATTISGGIVKIN